MGRKVVAEFNDSPSSHFEVEYQDGGGEWVGASGSWDSGSQRIHSMYENADAASLAARFVTRLAGWKTRVVEVSE